VAELRTQKSEQSTTDKHVQKVHNTAVDLTIERAFGAFKKSAAGGIWQQNCTDLGKI
jgi:hypothetical protein